MLLKVHETYLDEDYIINTDSILFIKDLKVYLAPNYYMQVRQIDITSIKRNMK